MKTVLKIENVSKQYRLGVVGTGTLSHDLNRWWSKVRGKEDPYLKIGTTNDRKNNNSDYVWALKDINLDIKKGEVIGIIGRNGAGKSTLLKLLSQVTNPTSGEIKIKGRIASLLEVGTGFHPELTGRENMYLNGAILGMSKIEIASKFDKILDFSGIGSYIDTPVKRYSSGMMVRLGFAVAAHLEPEILVVDEVLAVGDADFQKKCIAKMKEVASEGRTVLFVSHNMTSIRNLCEKGVVLESGKVIFSGSSIDAISYYFSQNENKENKIVSVIDPNLSTHNSGEAKFRSAFITNFENDIPISELSYQEKFKIKSSVEIYKDLENISISISLLNEFGEVVSYAYYANGNNLLKLKKGIYQISFECPLDLMPGNFALGLSIYHFYSGSTIDYIDYFYPFKVNKETIDNKKEYPWATVHGYVEMNNNWEIKKII
tara:strand:- start:117 stop:1409 length:1293 start_codon:yes stop_codon:yes gene_type:complete